MFSSLDQLYMTTALRLAAQGLYSTQPNPRVGCVIVKNQQIIGQGAHLKAGEPHAEVYALREAGEAARGADVYVTLEPCSHHGRTPPCMEALIAAGVKRVVVAMQDPNPLVAGQGVKQLQAHHIQVDVGLMQAEASDLNLGFIRRMTRQLPYVRCKVAASLDGRTALKNGKSQWITGEAARLDVQHWRAQSCAIVTGIGTVLADNPRLTVRIDNATRQPMRAIVDSQLQIPLTSALLAQPLVSPVMIAYAQKNDTPDIDIKVKQLKHMGVTLLNLPHAQHQHVDILALLSALATRGVNEVLIEAGQGLNGAFLASNLIDEYIFYYAPKLMGNDANAMFAIPELTHMSQAVDMKVIDVRQVGADIRIRAKPVKPS